MTRRRRTPPRRDTQRSAWDELYPTLDLHGDTAAEAAARVDRWLRERQVDGNATVRVITGRGLHSQGRPVLRDRIVELLGTLRGTVVGRFSVEHGGGVIRIELRPPRPGVAAPGRHRGTPPDLESLKGLDPDLRRRAEDTLRELGVEPTPVLVRAEVKRLQQEGETP